MRLIAPLFLLVLAACTPTGVIELGPSPVETEPGTPTSTEKPGDDPTFTMSVEFDDYVSWPMASITCVVNNQPTMYFASFDDEGWALFTDDLSNCHQTYFNVAHGSIAHGLTFNVNPYLLAEIAIDEASDVMEHQGQPDLEPMLWLWVFTDDYEFGVSEMHEPITVHNPQGSFWGCDEPQWHEPYGMPYGRPPPDAQDMCETTPSG